MTAPSAGAVGAPVRARSLWAALATGAGVGVLGGFTTFSTYMLDTRTLLTAGEPLRAGGYLFGTLLAGLLAVWLGVVAARTATRLKETR